MADVFAEGIEATVREIVGAIPALKKHEVSLGELAAKLAPDKSITSRRLRDATDQRYLVNRETRRGWPAQIVFGDPMPEMLTLLPESGGAAHGKHRAVNHELRRDGGRRICSTL